MSSVVILLSNFFLQKRKGNNMKKHTVTPQLTNELCSERPFLRRSVRKLVLLIGVQCYICPPNICASHT